jgi:hypothetical protein
MGDFYGFGFTDSHLQIRLYRFASIPSPSHLCKLSLLSKLISKPHHASTDSPLQIRLYRFCLDSVSTHTTPLTFASTDSPPYRVHLISANCLCSANCSATHTTPLPIRRLYRFVASTDSPLLIHQSRFHYLGEIPIGGFLRITSLNTDAAAPTPFGVILNIPLYARTQPARQRKTSDSKRVSPLAESFLRLLVARLLSPAECRARPHLFHSPFCRPWLPP